MKVSGVYSLKLARDRAYMLLQDPAMLAKCMPGCESLDRIAENEYAMRMKLALASVSGLFTGKVTIADANPPEKFRLIVEGSGKIGFMKGDGSIAVTSAGEGSSVQYDGDVQVGGVIANVGQRLIETTARMIIRRFFDRFSTESAAGGETKPLLAR